MTQRTIQSLASVVTTLAPSTELPVQDWLTTEAQAHQFPQGWLLAHTERGVIWGRYEPDKLTLDAAAHEPWLIWELLQQCRLFYADAELLLWRGPGGWQAQLRYDDDTESTTDYIDEEQLLWGNESVSDETRGFLPVREGLRGIRHTPPIKQMPKTPSESEDLREYRRQRARLRVRHYLQTDTDTGLVRIAHSRLVDVLEPEN
ncbi:MAG: hypothetical protein GFH25_541182n20 [Chloroflexi bacterium AL-N10]|nr:hypothetical protein [Chloroflexi bacterium AL-N10]